MLVLSGGMMVLISSLVMTESDTFRPVLMCPFTTSTNRSIMASSKEIGLKSIRDFSA